MTDFEYCCPKIVNWVKIGDYNEFINEISSITFTKVLYGIQIPDHCKEGVHHQQNIKIIFESHVSHERARFILDSLYLEWESLESDSSIMYANGGSVFTRPLNQHLWTLKSPCINCYNNLIKSGQNTSKSYLTSFL